MPAETLDAVQIATLLGDNPGWSLDQDRPALVKRFTFNGFVQAFGWMTQVAIIAEKLNHHPEWSNVYSRVDVVLTTHDAGALTALDAALLTAMEQAAKGHSGP